MVKLSNIFELPSTFNNTDMLEIDMDVDSYEEALLYTVYIKCRDDYSLEVTKKFNKYTKSLGYDFSFLNKYEFIVYYEPPFYEGVICSNCYLDNQEFYKNLELYITNKEYKYRPFSHIVYTPTHGDVQMLIFSIDNLDTNRYDYRVIFRFGIPIDEKTKKLMKLTGDL